MADYLSAGQLIVARLRDQLTEVPTPNIRVALSLDWLVKNALHPSIGVVYHDDKVDTGPGGENKNGKSQVVWQIWLVLVSVRNVADAGGAAQAEAGQILAHVISVLQGYEIRKELNPLSRVPNIYRKSENNGFVHFPLMFATKVITTGMG
ncbi:MAG: hypothetical protein PHU14_09290 [Methylovulum sp.]|nr:hypothetical protein [Methylovulum sp.]